MGFRCRVIIHFSKWTQFGACGYRFRVFWTSSRRLPGGDCTMGAMQLTLHVGVNGIFLFLFFYPFPLPL
jgi:hypothetical protein